MNDDASLVHDAAAMAADLIRLRRRIHREPEVGLDLPATQAKVLTALDGLGLEITTGIGSSSVVAVLRGAARGAEERAVLLRADMDALPMTERTALEFSATNGAMHACGHDFHTVGLVGAARLLARRRELLSGDVVFMFQPGEEGFNGASILIDEGVLDAAGRRVEAAFAVHVSSAEIPLGEVWSRSGPLLSASHGLAVTVHGVGTHGSSPSRGRDPIAAMAEMITAMQTMVTRRFDVFDPVVLTVGTVNAGTRRNIIPDTARFEMTIRRFSEANESRVREGVHDVLMGVARAHGVEVDLEYNDEYPVTINDHDETEFAASVARGLFGDDRYQTMQEPSTASEDFSRVLAAVPGAMMFVGATQSGADLDTAPDNHSPQAVFDEDALPDVAALYAGLALHRLGHLGTQHRDR